LSFISFESYRINLNDLTESEATTNSTHTQIRVTDFKLKSSNTLMFVHYEGLNEVIEDFENDIDYCKNHYFKKNNKCTAELSYEDFVDKMRNNSFILRNNEDIYSTIPGSTNAPCGFCDYYYMSIENDFSIRSYDTEVPIAVPKTYSNDMSGLHNRFTNESNLNRTL